jgi:superfamily I DNA/RNA helicase
MKHSANPYYKRRSHDHNWVPVQVKRVLTIRIAYLMNQEDAFNILSLTLRIRPRNEKRISDIVGSSEAKNLWMGTFHSVFARILRSEAFAWVSL